MCVYNTGIGRLSGTIENPDCAELVRHLRKSVEGEVLHNVFDRGRYATDASVYQMMPHAVEHIV